jgi:hypothetical protein
VLVVIAGLVFGNAAPGWTRLLPLLFPPALAFGEVVGGLDGTVVLRVVVAEAVTAVGIAVGTALEGRAAATDPRS